MNRLVYRDPVDPENPSAWAKWVRALEKQSGVYVIRDKRTHEVIYVGESHKGQLYSTITRHFQSWFSWGRHEYNRKSVEIAVRTMPPSAAYQHQVKLIRSLKPRDNEMHNYDDTPTNAADFQD
jgi:hypothetical protein